MGAPHPDLRLRWNAVQQPRPYNIIPATALASDRRSRRRCNDRPNHASSRSAGVCATRAGRESPSGTPNYHGSYSGALNDALDHCGRDEFAGTTIGLLEAAAGSYPGSAPCHLRPVSRTLGAWTLPTEVGIPDSHSTVIGDGIVEAALSERTRRLSRDLVEYAGVARYPEAVDGSAPVDGTRGGGDN